MIFFKLLSMPLYYFAHSSLINDQDGGRGYALLSVLKGVLWFIPSLALFLFLQNFFTLSYIGVKHYFYIFFVDFFIFSILAIGGYLLLIGLGSSYQRDGSIKDAIGFFSGFFLGVNILYLVLYASKLSFFLLFILPFLRILQVYFISFFADKFAEGDGFQRIVWVLAMLVALFFLSFVQFFYKANMPVFFIIFSLLSLSACPLSYYFLKDV